MLTIDSVLRCVVLCTTGYQGINTVFVTPDGVPFELQFDTPESLAMKEEECHSS